MEGAGVESPVPVTETGTLGRAGSLLATAKLPVSLPAALGA